MKNLTLMIMLTLCVAGIVWAVHQTGGYERADYTFSNGTEIKTVDPAHVTGTSEGRVVLALLEGLVRWDPKTLEPKPGAAESWEIDQTGTVYTFRLRENGKWSDGAPVTAHDFVYSWKRMLNSKLPSQYANQLHYLVGAEKFNKGTFEVGDPVEVEQTLSTAERMARERPYADGPLLYGKVFEILKWEAPKSGGKEDEMQGDRVVGVEIDGQRRYFRPRGIKNLDRERAKLSDDVYNAIEPCEVVNYDFRNVGIKAVDDRTLVITIKSPTPYFLDLIGLFALFPVQQKCVETHGFPAWVKPENYVGNGAFTLKWRRLRDRIRLVKNPLYWDAENVKLETVDVLACESATTNLNLYLAGEVDRITVVPPELVPALLEREKELKRVHQAKKVKAQAAGEAIPPYKPEFEPVAFLSTYYYVINVKKEPLDNIHFRRALAMALDREEIVTKLLRAGEISAQSMTPPELTRMPRYANFKPNPCPGFDPEGARAQLAKAGFPDGKGCPPITILYNTDEGHKQLAELIQSQWKKHLNIDIVLRNEEWASYLNSRENHNFQVARAGWTGDYPDPNTFLDMFLTGGSQNHGEWSNEEYDRLIEQAADPEKTKNRLLEDAKKAEEAGQAEEAARLRSLAEDPSESRVELLERAESILLDELPVIPIYYYVTKSMVRPYVQGYYPNIEDVHPIWAISIDKEAKREFLRSKGYRVKD